MGGGGGGKQSSSVDSDAILVRNREYFENLRKCYDVANGGGGTDHEKWTWRRGLEFNSNVFIF